MFLELSLYEVESDISEIWQLKLAKLRQTIKVKMEQLTLLPTESIFFHVIFQEFILDRLRSM